MLFQNVKLAPSKWRLKKLDDSGVVLGSFLPSVIFNHTLSQLFQTQVATNLFQIMISSIYGIGKQTSNCCQNFYFGELWIFLSWRCTVEQNSQETGRKYWATRSFVRLLAHTTLLFACSALLASLARFAALIHSRARSLTDFRARGKVNDLMFQNDLVLPHSAVTYFVSANELLPLLLRALRALSSESKAAACLWVLMYLFSISLTRSP